MRCTMLKRKSLMESISSNLYDFLKKAGKNLLLPDNKFLRDGLVNPISISIVKSVKGTCMDLIRLLKP